LNLTGEKGQWNLSELGVEDDALISFEDEIHSIKNQLEQVPKLRSRLEAVKKELGLSQ
jgi:hypothetical protein